MAADFPPPPAPPPVPSRSNPWRVIVVVLLAFVLILAALTAFWYITKTGPFSPIEPSTWALEATQVTDLQARNLDGSGVRVCVVDTGVDLTHPELQGVNLVAWKDFTSSRVDPYDDEGHGTAMTGIIFARGVLHGVAPKAELIAAKAITAKGSGTDAAIASAIRFCRDPNGNGNVMDDGANVISLSLGGSNHPFLGTATTNAVNNATQSGIYVVAAAGNDGQADDGDVESPASEASVIAVGAVDRQGVIAPFSSIGSVYGPGFPQTLRTDPDKKPEVVAPGIEIATPLNQGRYAYVSGTSPAAAFVSGIVALLLQDHPAYEWNAAKLGAFKTALLQGARREPGQQPGPHDPHYGYGLVQAAASDAAIPP